jgi:hypothetical protein
MMSVNTLTPNRAVRSRRNRRHAATQRDWLETGVDVISRDGLAIIDDEFINYLN